MKENGQRVKPTKNSYTDWVERVMEYIYIINRTEIETHNTEPKSVQKV